MEHEARQPYPTDVTDDEGSFVASSLTLMDPLEIVKLPEARCGCVRLPQRWVVERRCAGVACSRRLARDDERLPETVAEVHVLAFACLRLHRWRTVVAHRP